MYHDDKVCTDMLVYISSVIGKNRLYRVNVSQFFGGMVNKSTDNFILGNFIVFATFLEDGVPIIVRKVFEVLRLIAYLFKLT